MIKGVFLKSVKIRIARSGAHPDNDGPCGSPDEDGKGYSLPGIRKAADAQLQTPVASILEAAKLSGRATGIISTSEFMHATPADFSGHDSSRSNYDNITEQIVYNGLNVVLGGGTKYLTAAARKDMKNTIKIPRNKNGAFLNDKFVASDGVNVNNNGKWFVSQKLINLIK